MKQLTLVIATEFSATPGPRYERQGPDSGEKFREKLLLPKFDEAEKMGLTLLVDLDGTAGYATSFLEESFGGLARARGKDKVRATLQIKSDEQPFLLDEVWSYVDEAETAAKR